MNRAPVNFGKYQSKLHALLHEYSFELLSLLITLSLTFIVRYTFPVSTENRACSACHRPTLLHGHDGWGSCQEKLPSWRYHGNCVFVLVVICAFDSLLPVGIKPTLPNAHVQTDTVSLLLLDVQKAHMHLPCHSRFDSWWCHSYLRECNYLCCLGGEGGMLLPLLIRAALSLLVLSVCSCMWKRVVSSFRYNKKVHNLGQHEWISRNYHMNYTKSRVLFNASIR